MEWIVRIGDREYRTAQIAELKRWYSEGRIQPDTVIFHPVLQRWLYPREVEELRGIAPRGLNRNGVSVDDVVLGRLRFWKAAALASGALAGLLLLSLLLLLWQARPTTPASARSTPLTPLGERKDPREIARELRRTELIVDSLGKAVKGYAVDYEEVPSAASIAELAPKLSMYLTSTPTEDAWGTPLRYSTLECGSGRCKNFIIVSAGIDQRFEHADPLDYDAYAHRVISHQGDDFIYTSAGFVQRPESPVY